MVDLNNVTKNRNLAVATPFVFAQGTHQATKANFVSLAKKIVNGIGLQFFAFSI